MRSWVVGFYVSAIVMQYYNMNLMKFKMKNKRFGSRLLSSSFFLNNFMSVKPYEVIGKLLKDKLSKKIGTNKSLKS